MEVPEGWQRFTMQDLMAEFYDGPHATPPPASDGPIYLGIKNLTEDGHLDLSEIRHIAEKDFSLWTRRVEPRPGSIVFTYEASLHRYAIIPEGFRGCLGRRIALIRPNPEVVDTRLLLYVFLSPPWRSTVMQRINIGSTVDRIPLIDFPSFPVALPDLRAQKKIAAILSAYDELIVNNTRRIQILEEMAQAIYQEWFAEFRFPGYENVELVDSDLGPIPDAWEVDSLAHLVSTQYGYTESTSEEPIGPKFLRGMDMNKTSFIDWDRVPYCPIDAADAKKYRLTVDDILIIRMADPGKVGIVEQDVDAVFASYLVRLRPLIGAPLRPYFLFYFLNSNAYQGYVTGASTGTTRKSVSAKVMTDINLIVPPLTVQDPFEERVREIRRLITVLLRENANLRATRDLLLPRLISGEIDVSELAINLEAAPA